VHPRCRARAWQRGVRGRRQRRASLLPCTAAAAANRCLCLSLSCVRVAQRVTDMALVRTIAGLVAVPPEVLANALVTVGVSLSVDGASMHRVASPDCMCCGDVGAVTSVCLSGVPQTAIKPLGVEGCHRSRDSFARALYAAVFQLVCGEVRHAGIVEFVMTAL
jgi:hypothetical protein